nr:acyl-CoA dehydrogenase family protein [Zhihengliuella flava]
MLEGLRSRAGQHDAENTFAHQDFEALAGAGYLKAMLPADQGGSGWGFAETTAAQRLLAAHAPGTALAVNMHLVWAGAARVLQAKGDTRLRFVADWIAGGEVMAFGISEPGNDAVLFDSVTRAEHTSDGVAFTGRKIFTSLAPVFTRLGVFGKDDAGELIHGFVDRQDPGVRVNDDWDTLGMRASQSHSTDLDGAVSPHAWVHTRLPTGPQDDPLIFAIFASFLTLTASVYAGIADRAVELAAAHPANRVSLVSGQSRDQDPDVRWRVAQAGMEILSLDGFLTQTARDIDARVDHAHAWFPRLVTLRTRAGEVARSTVDAALNVAGGGQYFRGSELERLYRDALASLYHPSDAASAHRTVAAWLLGPLETPS